MREVEHRESFLMLNRCFIPSFCCGLSSRKITKRHSPTVYGDPCCPVISSLVIIHSNIARSITPSCIDVCTILTIGSFSEVGPTIVDAATVDVVRNITVSDRSSKFSFENHSMHLYSSLLFLSNLFLSSGIVFTHVFGRVPIPLNSKIVINLFDNCAKPLSDKNETAVDSINAEQTVYVGLLVAISTIPALLRVFGHQGATFWARNISARPLLLFFGRITSWLGDQLSLVHFSPPREMCGLATLQSFYNA